jgi:glycosyltransferase involved in cell wall biosynthesis
MATLPRLATARFTNSPCKLWRSRRSGIWPLTAAFAETADAMKRTALYLCYYNVGEPLVQSQVIAYLRELAARGIEMHLLTFERERLAEAQRQRFNEALAAAGITWHTLRYHQRPSLPATLYDIALGALKAWRICSKHDIRLIHARSHVPAAMALLLQRCCGYKFLFDVRGLLAEEYVDGGNWRAGDLKFRLTKDMERAFFRRADEFVMLTQRIKDELVATEPALAKRADDITVIPCCVDPTRFDLPAEAVAAYRAQRGWNGRRVLTYVGKLGLWYLPDEMAHFFAVAWQTDPCFFLQVLTQSDATSFRQALEKYGVPATAYDIRFATPEELSLILSASDAGLSFIEACYSKLASSPTKNGEYLAAGLPVVINAGIGDSDRQVEQHRLGVVLREFSEAEYWRAVYELCKLLDDSRTAQRCRAFVERELSLQQVGGPRYANIYWRLLRLPAAELAEDFAATMSAKL